MLSDRCAVQRHSSGQRCENHSTARMAEIVGKSIK